MDINLLRGLATIVVMITFFGICWWVYFYRSKVHYQEAEQLPFADEGNTTPNEGGKGK